MRGVGAYVESLHASWTGIARARAAATVHVDLAGWHLQVDVTPADHADDIGAAFDPCRGASGTPDLHVRVALGGPPPMPRAAGWSERDRLYYRDDRFEIHAARGVPLSAIDHATARGICWMPWTDLPYWERGAPLRALIAWFALRREALLLHGAAVADDDRAVLLVGSGGAGKTTTALAAWIDGMDYLGDDYVLVRARPTSTVARAYATAKIDPRTATLVPALGAHGVDSMTGTVDSPPSHGVDDKWVLRLGGRRGLDVVEAPIVAVVVPRVSPEPGLRRVSPGDALRAAVPTALFQLPCDRRTAFPVLAEVMRRRACYVLDTGPDPMGAASLVRGLARLGVDEPLRS